MPQMNSVLTPLLAITAWFLGLSVLVQVLQELYKFLTSSKARAFERALADFAGPFVVSRLQQDARLTVRGPLQFRRVSIAGRVLPMNADDLARAVEKGAPEWHLLAARALDAEVSLQRGRAAPPSPAFVEMAGALRAQLDAAPDDRQSAAFGDASRVAAFLTAWKVLEEAGRPTGGAFDAARVREAFRREFYPHFETIERHYDQFLQNFGYQYRRRNMRQTFTLAFIVTMVLNLPFEQIYVRATSLSPEQAIALAQSAQRLYADSRSVPEGPDAAATRERLRTLAEQALAIANSAANVTCGPRDAGLTTDEIAQVAAEDAAARGRVATCENVASVDYVLNPAAIWTSLADGRLTSLRFLFGCLISSVLITFGARFWNDASASLLRAARPRRDQQASAAPNRDVNAELHAWQ
jgi:hypothetical protein